MNLNWLTFKIGFEIQFTKESCTQNRVLPSFLDNDSTKELLKAWLYPFKHGINFLCDGLLLFN